MAVKIKLKRLGKIRAPYYRIVVADSRTKRDGRAIEEIGKYHPKADPSLIEVDTERVQHWLSVGAQPTDPVRKIFEITGDWQKFKGLPGSEGTLRTAEPKADRKAAFAAAVAETLTDSEAKPKSRTATRPARAKKAEAEEATAPAAAPKAETPKAETPKAETPKAETPKAEEPKAEEPTAEEPTAEEPKAEEPKAEEPKAETAKSETPKAEKPKTQKAKAETPAADAAADTTTEAAADSAGEADGGS